MSLWTAKQLSARTLAYCVRSSSRGTNSNPNSTIIASTTRLLSAAGNNQLSRFSTIHYEDEDDNSGRKKTALVVGSSGSLGRTVCRHLASKLGMNVLGADVVELPDDTDSTLDGFVQIPKHASLADITTHLVEGVSAHDVQLDAIIVASGGWQGDPPVPEPGATQEDVMKGVQAYAQTVENMMSMNLYPVVASGYLAQRFMAEEGLFVVIGATAALSSTPGMLGYGLSKVGAHHLVQTLGDTTGKAATPKAKRKASRKLQARQHGENNLDSLTVVGILPTTIDTPSNRDAMPKADFDKWTHSSDIAQEIGTWITKPPLRPHSGSLVKVVSSSGGAKFHLAR